MFEIFFQHPNVTGTVIAAIAAIELAFLAFGFEAYKNFFRRHPWLHLLFQESESRLVLVSNAILFLVVGVTIVGFAQDWMTGPFCGAICVVAFVNFLATVVYERRDKQGRRDEELG